jgi:hypothetical protein
MVIYTKFKGICKIKPKYINYVDEFVINHRWNSDIECFRRWTDYLKDHNLAIIYDYNNIKMQKYWRWKHDSLNIDEKHIHYINLPPLSEKAPEKCVFDKEKMIWEFSGDVVNYYNQVETFHDIILLSICEEIIEWTTENIIIL